jgi:MoxR-like ATPase
VDRASGDVLSLLLAMTDTEGSARWHHPTTGEVVTPRNGFSVVMTTNLEDIDLLPPALRDRFPVAIEITAPTLRALEVLSPDLRGPALRAAQGEGARRLSLRTFMTFDRLRGSLDGVRAAEILFGENAHDFLDALRVGSL